MYTLAGAAADMFLWGGIFGLAVVAAGVGAMILRRKLHPTRGPRRDTNASAFSIEGLEAIRASGGISEEEFRQLRRETLGLSEAPAETAPEPRNQAPEPEKPRPPLSPPAQDDDG